MYKTSKDIVGERKIKEFKESRLYKGPKKKEAILIFHGAGCNPNANEDMVAYFKFRGYSVYSPRMPGHATTEEEYFNTSIKEMCQFGQQALDYFYKENKNQPVFVTGLSLGAAITLYLGINKENIGKIKGIIPINAFMKSKFHKFLPSLKLEKAAEYALKNLGMKFLKERPSADMNKRRDKHIADRKKDIAKKIGHFRSLVKSHDYEESFSKDLSRQFQKMLDDEYKDMIEETVKRLPDEEKLVRANFKQMKDDLRKDFEEKYRQKTLAVMDIEDMTRIIEFEFYRVVSWKGLAQASQLSRLFRRRMHQIIVPIFILQSGKDDIVSPKSAKIIDKKCKNAPVKKKKVIPNTGHYLNLEKEKTKVFKLIEEFVEEVNEKKDFIASEQVRLLPKLFPS
ncbi:alpha/beta hydrolase [Nanoarchaeota archaeon]